MLLFFKVCLVLLGFKVYTSKSFGFHVQYWREVNFKVNHFTVVCVRRAISSASVVLIHYYWFQIKKKKQRITRLGALGTSGICALHLMKFLPPDQSGRVVEHRLLWQQCNNGMRNWLFQLIYLKNFFLFCKRRLCFSHHSIFCTAVHTN